VDSVWDFLGSYWWLIFFVGPAVGGMARGISSWDRQRRPRPRARGRLPKK